MLFFFNILLAKTLFFISKFFNIGSGSTWPGHLTLYFDKKIIQKILKRNPNLKIIFVIGTNGKTTTTLLLADILKNLGFKLFYNQEGANLLNGILSAILKNINLKGYLNYDYAIFEIDEFSFPLVYQEIRPEAIIILCLFRDQLDRYGEVNTIALRWFETLKNSSHKPVLVVNSDDPNLYYQTKKLDNKKIFFSIDKKYLKYSKKLTDDVDFIFCPECSEILNYRKISYSHLGDYYCQKCGFKKDFIYQKINIFYPLKGIYNVYNTNAVISLIKYLYPNIKDEKINEILKKFKPAFGRQEKIYYQNRYFYIFLTKNPAGFNQTIKTIKSLLKNKKENFFIVLNNRIPDGKDISWIWDINFKDLFNNLKKVFVSGDRLYDMVIRLIYEDEKIKKNIIPVESLKNALNQLIKLTKKKETIYVISTYSAMLEIRKILTGKKLI